MIERIFLAHPRGVGEGYREHAGIAWSFGSALVVAGAKCMIHAVVPALFPTAASDKVRELHGELDARRRRVADQFPDYVI